MWFCEVRQASKCEGGRAAFKPAVVTGCMALMCVHVCVRGEHEGVGAVGSRSILALRV